ncbi:MAG: SDR family NAD(P)-dependent oxidoreductase [Rhodospirillaceae bacterium]|nr:SDR family NAD(P)-dependent oxidoreductase [Rhodospirillaceae bacterium]
MTGRLWITGSGKGIGRAVAREYAARGWLVAASARTGVDLEALKAEVEAAKLPGRIVPYVNDVTDHDAVKRTFKQIEHDHGPLDQIIFNAGTHIPTDPKTFAIEPYRTLMEVNFMGAVNGLAAVVPTLVDRRRGHVAVVSSVAGYRGLPNAAAYGATKAALINMCESLKTQLDGMGVTISVINPGFVRTPLTDKNEFPMPFLMEPEDAARAVFNGMARRKFEIAFPLPFVLILKLLRMLPYALYFPLVRKTTGA